jgi:sarcosine oxidase gamma subunit
LFVDDYEVWPFIAPWDNLGAGLYVKDVTYAGVSIRRAPLRVGSALGSEVSLRVVLARDGGTISAHVTDRDGNPVNAYVLMLPAAAGSEIALADSLPTTISQTDQTGTYTSDMLAPGKYYVLATETPIDQSPECIAKLWRARIKAKEVDLNPGGAVRVELGVTALN